MTWNNVTAIRFIGDVLLFLAVYLFGWVCGYRAGKKQPRPRKDGKP